MTHGWLFFFLLERYQTENSSYPTFFLGLLAGAIPLQRDADLGATWCTPKPLCRVGFTAPSMALVRDLVEGIYLGWCLLGAGISMEGAKFESAFCMGTLVWLWGWLLSKQQGYLPSISGKLLQTQEPRRSGSRERQMPGPSGHGKWGKVRWRSSCSAACPWIRPWPLPTLPLVSFSLLACCSTYLHLLCDLW